MPFARGPATRRPQNVRPGNAPLHKLFHLPSGDPDTSATDPLARDARLARVEAALILADEPLTARKLADAASLADTAEAHRLIEKLRSLYDADGTAFQIVDLAGGFQLLTRAIFHPWLLRLRRSGHDLRLTAVALETLAVIAYKQPVMRAEVENVRGVQCAEVIRVLMEKGLVRITGRHASLGRPQLYGTTKKFLQAFGLSRLKDLPEVDSLKTPTPP